MSAVMTGVFRIGRDAEVRFIPSGEAVSNLSLAYNYGRRDGDGKQPTQWIEAGLWGDRAEKLAQHLTKGKAVFCVIEDLHIETFKKADGTPGQKLAGRVQRLDFVGPRESSDRASPAPSAAPRGAPAPTRGAPPKAPASGFDDMDDDIPF